MFGELLALHDKFTVCVGAGVPVPVAPAVVEEGWALLTNVRVALSAPVTCGLKVMVKGRLWPAVITAGSDNPLIAKRELFVLAPVTVTLAPLALRFPEAVPLAPTATFPTARVAGATVSWPAVTVAVPVSPMLNVAFDPFEVMVTLPLPLPADCGEYVTVKFVLCPAARFMGAEIPLSAKPVPLIATCEIVTVEPPVFVTVSDNGSLLPTCTVPKLKLAGFALNAPTDAPTPASVMVKVGFGASEVIVTLPLAAPVVCGANVTVNVALCETFNATGVEMPPTLNPLPLAAICEILTVDALLLVRVTVWLLCVPTVTLPKLSLVGFRSSNPSDTAVPDRASVAGLFAASLMRETVALYVPAIFGLNTKLSVAL